MFVDLIYTITQRWPKQEIFGLIDQLKRASVSIVLNIAEGISRTKRDFARFLDLARGSCFECVAIISIARNRGYIGNEEYNELYNQCTKISKMLSALKKSLQKP
jgi:four helix bundle protein